MTEAVGVQNLLVRGVQRGDQFLEESPRLINDRKSSSFKCPHFPESETVFTQTLVARLVEHRGLFEKLSRRRLRQTYDF